LEYGRKWIKKKKLLYSFLGGRAMEMASSELVFIQNWFSPVSDEGNKEVKNNRHEIILTLLALM
jgi:hypothetical protein